jgi:hypothetical protein
MNGSLYFVQFSDDKKQSLEQFLRCFGTRYDLLRWSTACMTFALFSFTARLRKGQQVKSIFFIMKAYYNI